jgi:hypothetical protein
MATANPSHSWKCKWGPCRLRFTGEDEFTSHFYHAHIVTAKKISRKEYNIIVQNSGVFVWFRDEPKLTNP